MTQRKTTGGAVPRTAAGQSVTSRALSVFDAFDASHRTLTLSQISRRADLPLATTQRLVRDLCEGRLLTRTHDNRYEVGARMWHLGQLSAPTTLRELSLPYLQDLVSATGHTVHLAVLDGSYALIIDRLSGSKTVLTHHSPGARLPLHCTGVGKVLLAHAPMAVRKSALAAMTRHTDYTVTDPRVLVRELDAIARTGLARSAQEHRLGVSSFAVPVGSGTSVVGALGILAPMTSPRMADTLPPLRAAAAGITAAWQKFGEEAVST